MRPPAPSRGGGHIRAAGRASAGLPAAVDVVIVGGGIGGLSAAHRLHELAGAGTSLALLESSERLGGLVRTDRIEGALIEAGPDSLVMHKPEGAALCRRIGLEHELIYPSRPAPTEIVRDGRLHPVPDGFTMFAPTCARPLLRSALFSWPGKLRMLAEPLVPRRRGDADESVRAFVSRRVGREAFERIAEPLLGGLFTADTDRLSMRMTMPRLLEDERRHGSLVRAARQAARRRAATGASGGPAFATLRGGLETLVRGLAARLPAAALHTNAPVESVTPCAEGFSVATPRGEIRARAVVLACPSWAAARMLADADPELARQLAGLHYASCATVNLVYRRADLARPLASFGFFVPRTERLPLLACSHVSEKFAGRVPEDRVLMRVFLGGAVRPELLDLSDPALVRMSHETLRALLAIRGEPLLFTIRRHLRSMPQPPVSDHERLQRVLARVGLHSGLAICGSAAGAIGLPDCIRSGEGVASDLVAWLCERRRASDRASNEIAVP